MRNPVYKAIRDQLVLEIDQGCFPVQQPFLSESQAIERFKVSRVTIRQAFELLEQEGIIRRIQGKGTFVNPSEAQPVRTVALIATEILERPGEAELLRSIEDGLERAGVSLILGNSNNDPEQATAYLSRLINQRVEAVVMICPAAVDGEKKCAVLLDRLRQRGIPSLLLDRPVGDTAHNHITIGPDHFQSAYAMTRHLLALGHRRIACCAPPHCPAALERLAGFRQCLVDHGGDCPPELSGTVRRLEDCAPLARRLAALDAPPSAVFAFSDAMAYRLINEFTALRMAVPEDVAVVGFGDERPQTVLHPVDLTTVRVPHWQVGQMAAALVLDLIERKPLTPIRIKVPCALVIRESCGARAVPPRLRRSVPGPVSPDRAPAGSHGCRR